MIRVDPHLLGLAEFAMYWIVTTYLVWSLLALLYPDDR
jgi:hypothetical protein